MERERERGREGQRRERDRERGETRQEHFELLLDEKAENYYFLF
jgi:hypothetical protein